MNTNTHFQTKLFQISAIFNGAIGLVILFAHQWLFSLLSFEVTAEDSYIAITQFAGLTIFTFGIGYYLASKNFQKNIGIIQLGTFAKIGVFAIFSYAYYHNSDMLPLFITSIADLTFATLFLLELKNSSRMASALNSSSKGI